MTKEDYKPAWIEFNVADDSVPQSLGEFEKIDDARKFINDNAVAIPISITAQRHMDAFEKRQIRESYQEVLEDTLPKLEREYSIALGKLNEAKRLEKEASEMMNAAITEAKLLAKQVKAGLVDMKLDELATFRIPYKDKYYFYTFIDNHLKLCAVRDIYESEKKELWTAGVDNSKLFFPESEESSELKDFLNNGEATTQEGQEE
jgi:hypothetical protein